MKEALVIMNRSTALELEWVHEFRRFDFIHDITIFQQWEHYNIDNPFSSS